MSILNNERHERLEKEIQIHARLFPFSAQAKCLCYFFPASRISHPASRIPYLAPRFPYPDF
jgi:hypothetical protein